MDVRRVGGAAVLSATADRLQEVAAQASDASGHFPAVYARVTREVERRCAAGHFDDPQRMRAFVERFASWYLRTLDDPAAAPRCWRAARDVAGDRRLLVVQHVLLGINAHVNHDLPQAVAELADETGDLPGLRGDFDAVNDVLAEAYLGVTRSLGRVARWTGPASVLGGERMFSFSLRTARAQAWSAAERFSTLDAAQRRRHAEGLDELVAVLAWLVVRRRFPLSLLRDVLRRLEEQDPRRVTAALLAL